MKPVLRTRSYQNDLDDAVRYIAKNNPRAAAGMWLRLDDQASKLSNPSFPRRPGRVPGTFELVAHKNYIIVFLEDDAAVTLLNVVHARRQYP